MRVVVSGAKLPPPAPRPEITDSVDVPGYQPGRPFGVEGVIEGVNRRANALKTADGGVGLCASRRLPFARAGRGAGLSVDVAPGRVQASGAIC